MQSIVMARVPTQAFMQVAGGAFNSPLTLSSFAPTVVAPEILTSSLPNGRVDTSYYFQLTASGTEPITWSVGSGFPDGWSLSSAGIISGFGVEVDSYTFEVTATNDWGSDVKEFTLNVLAALDGTPILLRRSNIPGKEPELSDLRLGELAINTYDGKLYLKKSGDTDSIVLVGPSPQGITYQGTWNASSNVPELTDGSGTNGYFYIVSNAGTQNLGSGNITFSIGDWVIYSESLTQWEKIPHSE